MALGAAVSARQGIVVIVGLGGGTLPFSFFSLRAEGVLTTSYWGSHNELAELLHLAQQQRIRVDAKRYGLDDVNSVLDELEHGRITGRAVLVP